jgi:hypothetical protein
MVLIQLLLPSTAMAHGGDAAMLALTRVELAERFKDVTTYLRSPVKEWWTEPDGDLGQDDAVMVEVVTQHFDRHWWRSYAAKLAGRFRQDAIHVQAMAVDVTDKGD